ncbi:glycosyltransferase family 2 protein [Uliginosibacterium sp. 31-16]|uniref:glycosyltransferase family 2 protein n=1 Tax=Uliginosibacterium sp. 31-16 TaxID=3068315 RepID=UPI00273F12A2|nr:glycosyltransferase family 2 protein [Uliginosibacterium sp. 31-16]MDP5238443.1 glycosyltransferase family 2 protein [Uliginosibacterium sp. 31-16]
MVVTQRSPRVAALIVNWRSAAVLQRCLAALAGQMRPFDRVLVVDNDPDCAEPLPIWSGASAFMVLRMEANLGFAAANNHGLGLCADCDYVALINPDAFLAADWLERMLDAANRYPGAGSFASQLVQDGDPSRLDGLGDAFHFSGAAWRTGHGELVREAGEEEIFSPCAAAALYRRQAVLDVGGFDERFFCYMEDVDLGFRLRLAGWASVLIPSAVANHVGSATTGGKRSPFAVYHGHRNMVWCYVKNMPGPLLWLCLPAHLLMNLAVVCLYALRGQGLNILRAKRDVLRGIPAIWRERRVIQSKRKVSCREIWRVLDKRLWFRT